MSREVRRVPANWEHPKNERGHYIPLFDRDFAAAAAEWDEDARKWAEGLRSDFSGGWVPIQPDEGQTLEGWAGPRPEPADYMPSWRPEERTHLQMYETCTEGTPISPVMSNAEDLAKWLAENKASAFGSQTASYEEWLAMIRVGHSMASAVGGPGIGLINGVAAVSQLGASKS
jgi:hypothetical protein